ncbi:MAG: ABC transporter permease [Rhodospirillales bacterium]|jgi:putative ABC transport system permease protein|nr:ABC transporter permease [Rhodospirillaceae bacterium]MDP6428997.1 ABC transporter permease [Rhodospirillales bacterium]MDP6646718.1 ABC transporter permease [Rhodospirillales bacterium]MDP6840575.1 ABC transporter permease [Rhodospirillales bacterium]
MMEVFNNFYNLVPVTFAQSLIYALVAAGIMIPFRILSFPDLTSEGSFPLGGSICAALLVAGVNPFAATLLAVCGAFAAGCCTALIHLKLKINTLLAGILVMTMLFSINLRIMGKSNVALFSADNLLEKIWVGSSTDLAPMITMFVIMMAVVCSALFWFFKTEIGMAMRAVGANLNMASAQGISTWAYTIFGLGMANGLNGLAGAVLVQQQGYADVNMGLGILIDGLAAVIIGETLLGRQDVWRQVAAPFLGSIVYYQLISLGLAAGLEPSDIKLATGIFVLITLGLPVLKGGAAEAIRFRE